MFIIGFVGALILIVKPIQLNRFAMLRDMSFCLLACAWVSYSFKDQHFSYFEANGRFSSLIYTVIVSLNLICP